MRLIIHDPKDAPEYWQIYRNALRSLLESDYQDCVYTYGLSDFRKISVYVKRNKASISMRAWEKEDVCPK